MSEARDRLERPVDYAAQFNSRRLNGILLDQPELGLFGPPVQRPPSGTVGNTTLRPVGLDLFVRRGALMRRPGNVRGQGRENTPVGAARRGRGRAPTSVLPYWYPRTPLRDITSVVRAIERRRALGEVDGRIETLTPQRVGSLDSSLSGAQLEHGMVTPAPAVGMKRSCPPSAATVRKVLLDITKEESGEAEFLTPQKKLLNSIEKVEKVVMEEIQKANSTPSAKRAERKKRVRTLMSMR